MKLEKKRENVTLGMPRILVLINDRDDLLFSEVSVNGKNNKLYDFDLMIDGGHIEGYKIDDVEVIKRIVDILISIKNDSEDGFLYAVEMETIYLMLQRIHI